MDVIKCWAPPDTCCSSGPKPHFDWTESMKETASSPVLGCSKLGGKGGNITWTPAGRIRHRTRCFPTMLPTGGWSEVSPEGVSVSLIKSTRDNLCYLQKSFVMCFPGQKVKEWGLELKLERLQKKLVWKRTLESKKKEIEPGQRDKFKEQEYSSIFPAWSRDLVKGEQDLIFQTLLMMGVGPSLNIWRLFIEFLHCVTLYEAPDYRGGWERIRQRAISQSSTGRFKKKKLLQYGGTLKN